MALETKKIAVAPDSEVARVLEEAAKAPFLVDVNDSIYRVYQVGRPGASTKRTDDIWDGYDAEKVRQAVAETAGSWADLDTDALIAEIYQAREDGSRPADRP